MPLLRKLGITDYEILTKSNHKIKPKKSHKVKESPTKKRGNDERVTELEKKVEKLMNKKKAKTKSNSEQITDKLATLEKLTRKLLANGPVVIEKRVNRPFKKVGDEPVVEEMEDKFIPDIDVSNMKMKKGSKKTVKRDNVDLDDSADLLSKIIGQEED